MTAALSGRTPLWARSCSEMSDADFIKFGILRCIGRVNSGRDFYRPLAIFMMRRFLYRHILIR